MAEWFLALSLFWQIVLTCYLTLGILAWIAYNWIASSSSKELLISTWLLIGWPIIFYFLYLIIHYFFNGWIEDKEEDWPSSYQPIPPLSA